MVYSRRRRRYRRLRRFLSVYWRRSIRSSWLSFAADETRSESDSTLTGCALGGHAGAANQRRPSPVLDSGRYRR